MICRRSQVRILALFVVAFICLNAGGAMCVAYCQTFAMQADGDHCPLKKASEHCDRETDNPSFEARADHDADCCPMTVSFFGGPVEKPSFSVDSSTEIIRTPVIIATLPFVYVTTVSPVFNYRSPPLDRRVERIKHCIIRI